MEKKLYFSGQLQWGCFDSGIKQSETYYIRFDYDPRKTKINSVKVDFTVWWKGFAICSTAWAEIYFNDSKIWSDYWGATCESRSKVLDVSHLFRNENYLYVKAFANTWFSLCVNGNYYFKYNITVIINYEGEEPSSTPATKPPGWKPTEEFNIPVAIGIAAAAALGTTLLLYAIRKGR
jgi:hypothetical protein